MTYIGLTLGGGGGGPSISLFRFDNRCAVGLLSGNVKAKKLWITRMQ